MEKEMSIESLSFGVDLVERFPDSLVPYSGGQESYRESFVPCSGGQESDRESLCLRVNKLEDTMVMMVETMELLNQRAKKEQLLEEDLVQLKARLSCLEASGLSKQASNETAEIAATTTTKTVDSSALEEDLVQLKARLSCLEASGLSKQASNGTAEIAATTTTETVDGSALATESQLDALRKELSEVQDWRAKVEALAHLDSQAQLDSKPGSQPSLAPPSCPSPALNDMIKARVEYVWEDSVYDGLLIIHLRSLGITPVHSLTLILGFFLNILMVVMTFVIVGGPEFSDTDNLASEDVAMWRTTDGHFTSNVDPVTQMTLVTRVCGGDRTLSTATNQWNLKYEIDKYQEGFLLPQGLLLCLVAILLWALCCAQEIRKAIEFFAAIWNIPRTGYTEIELQSSDSILLKGLARRRVVLGTGVAGIRVVFAVTIMFQGATWLARTTSIENLLLNASALGFVLDIDNIIFAVVAPARVIGFFKNLSPGPLPRKRWISLLPVVLSGLVAIFMLYNLFGEISTVMTQMDEWVNAACEPKGSLKFATTITEMGWVAFTDGTLEYQDQATQALFIPTQQFDIIQELQRKPEKSKRYAWSLTNAMELMYMASVSADALVNAFSCFDNNTLEGEATIGDRIWAATGEASFRGVQNCAEIKQHCFITSPHILGQNIRFLCADTCGCSDKHSGLWDLGRAKNGCPELHCHKKLVNSLRQSSAPCKDWNKTHLLNHGGWKTLLNRLNETRTITEEPIRNLSTLGCEAFRYFPVLALRDVCSMQDVVVDMGAAPFCPESCHCRNSTVVHSSTACPGLCPQSCCYRSEDFFASVPNP